MKNVFVSLMGILLLSLVGCDGEPQQPKNESANTEDFSSLGMIRKMDWTFGMLDDSASGVFEHRSLIPQVPDDNKLAPTSQNNSSSKSAPPAIETQNTQRKIIRNGKLTLEIESPAAGQQKIAAIVESRNGFVVVSEFSQFDRAEANQSVTISVRIPAAQFDDTLAAIRTVSSRIIFENITGQDMTEEFLDLQARSRTQKALEEQLLQIMKKTSTVSNALEVQRELTNVRTEIEKLTGRIRFLENQAALSTITILLQTPSAIVAASTSGVGDKFTRAFADGIKIALGITLFLLRALLAVIPILLFVVLPIRFLRKRFSGRPMAQEPASPTPIAP